MVAGGTVVEGAVPGADDDAAYRSRVQALGLGRFVRVAGRGGMGAVVLLDGYPDADGPVVVKILRRELLEDPAAVRRFRTELTVHRRLWSELQAPRLVPCLSVGDTGEAGGMFGVLPYYPEGSLEAAAAKLRPDAVLRCLADAAEGLGALHGHGYVHRDVCPKNIFVSMEGGVPRGRLGDLGVAIPLAGNTLVSETAVERERGFTVGHLGYIDPWYAGTKQGDLFGIGASLYALLSAGEPPVTAQPEGLRLPPREQCRPGLGRGVYDRAQRVLTRLTARDMSRRYQSASEAATAVQELAEAHLEDAGSAAWGKRRLAVLLAGLAAIAAAGGLVFLAGSGTSDSGSAGAASRTPAAEVSSPQPGVLEPPGWSAAGAGNAAGPATSAGETDGRGASPNRPPAAPDPSALVRAASGRVEARRFEEAAALLRRALAEAPADPEATSLLALILSREPGGSQEAARLLATALDRYPANGDLRLQLSRLRASGGDLDGAARLLDEAPPDSTHREELARWRVTLERLRHRGG